MRWSGDRSIGRHARGADIQAAVPSLVASVKDAGLLLATCGDAAAIAVLKQGASDGRTVDAFVHDGYVFSFGHSAAVKFVPVELFAVMIRAVHFLGDRSSESDRWALR